MKVGYIVACWFESERRTQIEAQTEDRYFFVRRHIKALSTLNHNIDSVVFSINSEKSTSDGALDYQYIEGLVKRSKLRSRVNNVKVVVRENQAYSYGGYDQHVRTTLKDMEYTFCIEDDYEPKSDFFEMPFIRKMLMEGKDDVVMCVQQTGDHAGKHHASISNGVINNKAYNSIPNETVHEKNKGADWHQLFFLHDYETEGMKIMDVSDEFASIFYNHERKLINYGKENGATLILPIMY
tara:strand:- start:33 stop:749 length:717 start_codon:yes stop_codon:yes gene_type:complete